MYTGRKGMDRNRIVTKGLVFAIILLFIGLTAAPSIIATIPTTGKTTRLTCAPYSTTDEGTLSGYVNDTENNLVAGALVRVYFHETYRENHSDATGYYHVTEIPICYCMKNATCSKDGYLSLWVNLSISENTTYDFVLPLIDETCYPVFNGTGHGWYTSPVNVTFLYDPGIVAKIYYNHGDEWEQYSGPFVIYKQGNIDFRWEWEDYYGNTNGTFVVLLKIDYTPPVINLTLKNIGASEWLCSATAYDAISGLSPKVEFYVDDVLMSTVFAPGPYIFIFTGTGRHAITAIASDSAGNIGSDTAFTYGELTVAYTFIVGKIKDPYYEGSFNFQVVDVTVIGIFWADLGNPYFGVYRLNESWIARDAQYVGINHFRIVMNQSGIMHIFGILANGDLLYKY